MRNAGARPGSLTRRAVSITAFAVMTALAAPAVATAAPFAAAPAAGAPKVDQQTLDSVGAFFPAIIGSVATPGPDGKANPALISQATALATAKGVPPQVGAIWDQVVGFLNNTAKPSQVAKVAAANNKAANNDPIIPTGPNAPKIQQFLYPTIGFGCTPAGNSVGTALVTAGPQAAPAPGPARGQAGYVYTSLGTGPAVDNARNPLIAIWINIDTGRTGQINLKRNAKINAVNGPGTFTAIANTGRGRVLSAIYGAVTTKNNNRVNSCTIVPTVGLSYI